MAVYVGRETKMVKNEGKYVMKMSSLMKNLNKIMYLHIAMIGVLVLLCS
jgi:hypothetical protein